MNREALDRIESCTDYEFFTVLPLEWRRSNIHPLNRERVTFSDVVASADAVVSKPGFGIVSNCVVNRKPLVYADREDFLEYQVLEAAIRKYVRHVRIPAASLYRGDLRESLENLWKAPDPAAHVAHGGDAIAAQRIIGFL
jgi:L-arabinokinase